LLTVAGNPRGGAVGKDKERTMNRISLTLGVVAAVLSLIVGIGSASASSRAARAGTTVTVASSGLGRILVDGHGHSLYLFAGDKRGKSACAGMCAAFWPPVLASGKTVATAGAKTSLLGTTRRADGRVQVTYNHHPLYAFVKDVRKGQTNGEGVEAFGAKWYALSAGGTKVVKSNAGGSSPNPAGGGYGSSGYGPGY
jgi:predicted lipoprotein with Yx(FWY)xxD motif